MDEETNFTCHTAILTLNQDLQGSRLIIKKSSQFIKNQLFYSPQKIVEHKNYFINHYVRQSIVILKLSKKILILFDGSSSIRTKSDNNIMHQKCMWTLHESVQVFYGYMTIYEFRW